MFPSCMYGTHSRVAQPECRGFVGSWARGRASDGCLVGSFGQSLIRPVGVSVVCGNLEVQWKGWRSRRRRSSNSSSRSSRRRRRSTGMASQQSVLCELCAQDGSE